MLAWMSTSHFQYFPTQTTKLVIRQIAMIPLSSRSQRASPVFWNTWKAELTKRNYKILDEILPTRVKSVKEWMRKTGYDGTPSSVLKDYRDGVGSRAPGDN